MRKAFAFLSAYIGTVAISGCAPSVSVTRLQDSGFPPLAETAPIAVYYTKAPECPYEEIAILKAKPGELDMLGGSESKFVDALKKKARKLGGSALILGPAYQTISSLSPDVGGRVNVNQMSSQEGVVIRFKSRDCQK